MKLSHGWSTLHALVVLAATLALVTAAPPPARAVTRTDGEAVKPTDKRGDNLVYDPVTGTWQLPLGDANGVPYVREHTPLSAHNSGVLSCLSSQPIAAKGVAVGTPFRTDLYSQVTLLVSWARGSLDSLALDIFPIGKVSQAAADGYDYLLDLSTATVPDTLRPCYSIRTTRIYPPVQTGWAPVWRYIPKNIDGLATTGPWNKAMLTFSVDKRFPWANVVVVNRSATVQRDSVVVEYYAKGN